MNFNSRFHLCAVVLCLLTALPLNVWAQQPAASQAPQPAQNPAGRAQLPANFVVPSDVNVFIGSDPRLFAVMAALNLAGYNYEPGGRTPSDVRQRLVSELKPSPELVSRLQKFYQEHRRTGVTDESAQAAPYVALAFVLEEPPSLLLAVPPAALPPDVARVAGFASLVGELFRQAKIQELLPKYSDAFDNIAAAYYQPIGEMIHAVLSYLHTTPTIYIPAPTRATNAPSNNKEGAPARTRIERDRLRRLFVITDPLNASDTIYLRNDIINMLGLKDRLDIRLGDDYIVAVGPAPRPNMREIRRAYIRFVLDPIIERYTNDLFDPESKKKTGLSENIMKLVGELPATDPHFRDNVSLVLRESLVYAVDAGMMRAANRVPQERALTDEDNRYNLSRQYERGAVLVFHFYEKLVGLESSGINFTDLYPSFLRAVNFDLEAKRAQEFPALRAKVESRRAAERVEAERAATSLNLPGLDPRLLAALYQADELIEGRQYEAARSTLKQILTNSPGNARALFGLAQIANRQPSAVELDAKADEDDKYNAQEQRLGQAVLLYRQAIEAASPEHELWIKSRAHVAIGRIFDFFEKRDAAVVEYEAALKLGDVKGGAYREAAEGRERPFQPRTAAAPAEGNRP